MADEVVDKGSVNSSIYLSKEDEAERNEIFYSSQCLDFIDLAPAKNNLYKIVFICLI